MTDTDTPKRRRFRPLTAEANAMKAELLAAQDAASALGLALQRARHSQHRTRIAFLVTAPALFAAGLGLGWLL